MLNKTKKLSVCALLIALFLIFGLSSSVLAVGCDTSADCALDQYCLNGNPSTAVKDGTCQERPGINGNCGGDVECKRGLICVNESPGVNTCQDVKIGEKDASGTVSPFTDVQTTFGQISEYLKYFYGAIIAISMVFIILGGLKYVTASGDPEKAAVGKKQILYGVIGIAIILGVWVIVSLVANIIGVGTVVKPF